MDSELRLLYFPLIFKSSIASLIVNNLIVFGSRASVGMI